MTHWVDNIREVSRHAMLDALSLRDRVLGTRHSAITRPRVHFLYLHSVPAPELGRFAALLDELGRTHTFISHSEAAAKVVAGDIDRPYLSVSFDDGFASNVGAARVLDARGIQGCFFITTNFVGTTDLHDARRFFGGPVGVDEGAMTWSNIEDLLAKGHAIGNHTRNHPDLSELSATQLEDEIGGAAEDLKRHLGETPAHFAWPFGRFHHASPDMARVVLDTGHHSYASAERGAHVVSGAASAPVPCLRRDHIMTSWPLRHSWYFIAASARRSGPLANHFAEDWHPPGHEAGR